jgi:hypothetical protein
MLKLAKRTGSITGVPIAKGRVRLNHLFFVDDSLFLTCLSTRAYFHQLSPTLSLYLALALSGPPPL